MALGERTGVLVVRAWIEGEQLKARITTMVGLEQREPVVTAAATREQVHEKINSWLDDVEDRSGERGPPVTSP